MTLPRFWLPEGDHPDAPLYPVVAVASQQCLYAMLEGPALPPPTKEDYRDGHDPLVSEMVAICVTTASGDDLLGVSTGGSFGKTGRWPRTLVVQADLPPDLSQPLTVQLRREDGSAIWEFRMLPQIITGEAV